ncbi:PAS domain S-box protein [Streptomyces sp. NPDC002004]
MFDQDEPPADAVVWRNRALLLFDRVAAPIALCDAHGAILLANPALATEWGIPPGRLQGRNMLDMFRPVEAAQVCRIREALRLRRRSRYPISVSWQAADGTERHGELAVEPVSDSVDDEPALLVLLRMLDTHESPAAAAPAASPAEARILALLAGGATTARAARETGLTTDGVTYHLRRLTQRWSAANRTELIARAYAYGVLIPGVWPPTVAPTAQ